MKSFMRFKTLVYCAMVSLFAFTACQQSPAVAPNPAVVGSRASQGRAISARTLSLTSESGMQIVAHDGDKEVKPTSDFRDQTWNYSSASAQSAFDKGVGWLETDVIVNLPTGILYMHHDEKCVVDGQELNLMTDNPADLDRCAERFANQFDTLNNPGKWMIEIKGDSNFGSSTSPEYRTAVTDALYNALVERNRLGSEIITSMDTQVLSELKARADRDGKTINLGRVYPMSFVVNGDQRPTKTRLDADKAAGFAYASAAVKDWSYATVDYAKSIGLQTMGWGWDDWWTGGRDPVADNERGIDLCMDFLLTEAITDLKDRDRSCKRGLHGFTVNTIGFTDKTSSGVAITGKTCDAARSVVGLDIAGFLEFTPNYFVSDPRLLLDGTPISSQILDSGTRGTGQKFITMSTAQPYSFDPPSGLTVAEGVHTLRIEATLTDADNPDLENSTLRVGKEASFTAAAKTDCTPSDPPTVDFPITGIAGYDDARAVCGSFTTQDDLTQPNVITTVGVCPTDELSGDFSYLLLQYFNFPDGAKRCYVSPYDGVRILTKVTVGQVKVTYETQSYGQFEYTDQEFTMVIPNFQSPQVMNARLQTRFRSDSSSPYGVIERASWKLIIVNRGQSTIFPNCIESSFPR